MSESRHIGQLLRDLGFDEHDFIDDKLRAALIELEQRRTTEHVPTCRCLPGIQGTSCPVHANEVALKIIARNEELFREQAIKAIEALPSEQFEASESGPYPNGYRAAIEAALYVLRGSQTLCGALQELNDASAKP